MSATPSTNGRPAVKAKTTPRKRAAKPIDRRGVIFADFTLKRFAEYEDQFRRMKKCPGYRLIQKIVTDAQDLRSVVVDFLTNYGAGTGSATERFLTEYTEFGGKATDLFDAMIGLAVDLDTKASLLESRIPGIH